MNDYKSFHHNSDGIYTRQHLYITVVATVNITRIRISFTTITEQALEQKIRSVHWHDIGQYNQQHLCGKEYQDVQRQKLTGLNSLLRLVIFVGYSVTGFFTSMKCYTADEQMMGKVGKITRKELVLSSNPTILQD